MAQPTVARASTNQHIGSYDPDLMAPIPSSDPSADPRTDLASDTIIRSKVQAPVVRDTTLERGRLLGWLDEHADERIRVLAAEAGYGKTTLLADWARRTDRTVRWLKLDPTDGEWTTFLSYLVAAFQEGDAEFGLATRRLLSHVATLGPSPDQVASQFLGELGRAITVPTVLVIDDLQHLDGNDEARRIIERLIERAPESLTFILSGRHRPDLRLGRMTAQGKVIALDTDDLRFTHQETGALFANAYRMPLDGDLVNAVDARTEGWGASLQLLYSSIRSQRPAEVREFINGLAGSQEPLYDFLAEEVLERQAPLMQRVLVHAAILDRIVPALVVAALAATDDAPSPDAVIDALDAADELGLMSRNAPRSSSRRFHPLLREFLTSHLVLTVAPGVLRSMHLNVAHAAEAIHWPTSAHHYIEGGNGPEAMRVISDAGVDALGTGGWGLALELLARIPEVPPSAPVQVIRARHLVSVGRASEAIVLLQSIDSAKLRGSDLSLFRIGMASAFATTDRNDAVLSYLRAIVDDPESPELLASVAECWFDLYVSDEAQTVAVKLARVADQAERRGLYLYAGVAHHNLSGIMLAVGQPSSSIDEALRAIALFSLAADDSGNAASSHITIAHAAFDLDDMQRCREEMAEAQQNTAAQPDVFAESAVLEVWQGRLSAAETAVARGLHALGEREHLALAPHEVRAAQLWLSIAIGDLQGASDVAAATNLSNWDRNHAGLVLLGRACIAVLSMQDEIALAAVEDARASAVSVGASRWMPHFRVLRALAQANTGDLSALLATHGGVTDSVLLVTADAIGRHLDKFETCPSRIEDSVRRYPDRWRPVLRHSLSLDSKGQQSVAAHLLSEIGRAEDVGILRRWERPLKRGTRESKPSMILARRVSPTLRIMDLGRSAIIVGSRKANIGEVRRKASSLLLFLVSRPRQTATREQVFDALWPELDADQAANSLHQTLYFLRRALADEPEGVRPLVEYIPVESEIIYLDPQLVHIESAAFVRQASEFTNRDVSSPQVPALLQSYRGQFAPEFEYDDWAISWRDRAHGTFLELSERAAKARLHGAAPEAAAILRHALEVDPEAAELKPLVAVALYLSGSRAAARMAYAQFRDESLRDYGEAVPSLKDLIADALGGEGRPGEPPPPLGPYRQHK